MRKLRHRTSLLVSSILGGTLALFASPREARATDVTPGSLPNTHWIATGNPYVLTGDITVPAGISLVIDAGVIVQIAAGDTEHGGGNVDSVDITIKGSLTVNGTPTAPVLFEPAAGNDQWIGLDLATGSSGFITDLELDDVVAGIGMSGTMLDVHALTVKNAVFGVLVTSGQTTVDRAIMTGKTNPGNSYASAFSSTSADDGTTLTVTNAVASGFRYGGYFSNASVTANLINVTFVTSTGADFPLGVYGGATVNVDDSILSAPADFGCGIDDVPAQSSVINVAHSLVTPADSCVGFTPGAGVIHGDPKFVSATDFHLSAASPCIDTAASTDSDDHDVEGSHRPVDGNGDGTATVDMGAYEFQGTATAVDAGTSTSDGGSTGTDGGSSGGSDAGSNAAADGGSEGSGGGDDGGCAVAGSSTGRGAIAFVGFGVALVSRTRRRGRRSTPR